MMMKASGILRLALMTSCAVLPGVATAGVVNPFNIEVIFDNPNTAGVAGDHNMTPAQQAVFSNAETFWERRITGNRYDFVLPDLEIFAYAESIDGVGNTLASAGPNSSGTIIGDGPGSFQDYFYTNGGVMRFDTADIGDLFSAGGIFDVIVHEMAHVIGFGTLWDTNVRGLPDTQGVYVSNSGEYTGQYAVDAYNAEFGGPPKTFVPVELGGGAGTANGHWDEADFLGGRVDASNSSDLMTGFLNPASLTPQDPLVSTTLSDTTIASFADIGYLTIVTDPFTVPVPPAIALGLTAFGALGAVSRRRRRRAAA